MLAVLPRRLGALVVLAVAAAPLAAQDRRSNVTGTGTLDLRGLTAEAIVKTELTLAPQGAFELTLIGQRPLTRWSIKGQYVGNQWDRRVELRVRDALSDGSATGDGSITFDQFNAPREITIRGRTRTRDYSFSFRGDGSGGATQPDRPLPPVLPPQAGGPRPPQQQQVYGNFDQTMTGRGTLREQNNAEYLQRMRVRLREDGTAELRGEGERDAYTVKARWRDGGQDRIQLDIVEYNGTRADGSGEVRLRGRQFDQMALRARTRNGAVEMRFATDNGYGSNGYGDNRGRGPDDDRGRGRGRDDDDRGRGRDDNRGRGRGQDDDRDRDQNGGNYDVPVDYDRQHVVRGTVELPRYGQVNVQQAGIRLSRNGDARLTLKLDDRGRDQTIELLGTWTPTRDGTAGIRWSRIDGEAVNGSGLVTFWNGREATRIRGMARSRDGRLAIDVTVVR